MKTISCMNIDKSLLYSMGAEDRNYKKRESVFKKKDSRIIRLYNIFFVEMADGNPDLSMEVNACFSQGIYYQLKMGQSLASENPVQRLKGLPDYLKSYHHEDCLKCFHIELTRQQIAKLTGMRVATLKPDSEKDGKSRQYYHKRQ